MATMWIGAAEVAEAFGCSMTKAYGIIRQLNAELSAAGYITLSGKVSRAYFNEKWYGGSSGSGRGTE